MAIKDSYTQKQYAIELDEAYINLNRINIYKDSFASAVFHVYGSQEARVKMSNHIDVIEVSFTITPNSDVYHLAYQALKDNLFPNAEDC